LSKKEWIIYGKPAVEDNSNPTRDLTGKNNEDSVRNNMRST
jgi:hypothetical protein